MSESSIRVNQPGTGSLLKTTQSTDLAANVVETQAFVQTAAGILALGAISADGDFCELDISGQRSVSFTLDPTGLTATIQIFASYDGGVTYSADALTFYSDVAAALVTSIVDPPDQYNYGFVVMPPGATHVKVTVSGHGAGTADVTLAGSQLEGASTHSADVAITGPLGQTTMSASIPVTIASDQTGLADVTASATVSGNGTSATFNVAGAQGVSIASSGGINATFSFQVLCGGSAWESCKAILTTGEIVTSLSYLGFLAPAWQVGLLLPPGAISVRYVVTGYIAGSGPVDITKTFTPGQPVPQLSTTVTPGAEPLDGVNDAQTLSLDGRQSVGYQFATTGFSGTVQAQQSFDYGSTWQLTQIQPADTVVLASGSTSFSASTTTGAGAMLVSPGATHVRWVVTARTAGSIIVRLTAGFVTGGSRGPQVVAMTDGTDLRVPLTDTSSRQMVVGAVANGASASGVNPVAVAGSDGSTTRTIRTTNTGIVSAMSPSNVDTTLLDALNDTASISCDGRHAVAFDILSNSFLGTIVAKYSVQTSIAVVNGTVPMLLTDGTVVMSIVNPPNGVRIGGQILLPAGASWGQLLVSAYTSGDAAVTLAASTELGQIGVVHTTAGALANGAQTAVSSSAVSVLAANTARKAAIIQNVGTNTVRIGIAAVTATTGFQLRPGASIVFEQPFVHTGAILAIRESADSTVLAQEIV